MNSRMTQFWKHVAAFVLALTLLPALAGCDREASSRREPLRVSQTVPLAPESRSLPMPEFRLKDISGHEVSSEQFRGKVLLVDFWATWCEPCKFEMPGFQDLQNRYGDRGLTVIGIAEDSDTASVAQFAKKFGISYTLVMSTSAVEEQFGGILAIPTTFLVDRNRLIRRKAVGFDHKETFENALKQIL